MKAKESWGHGDGCNWSFVAPLPVPFPFPFSLLFQASESIDSVIWRNSNLYLTYNHNWNHCILLLLQSTTPLLCSRGQTPVQNGTLWISSYYFSNISGPLSVWIWIRVIWGTRSSRCELAGDSGGSIEAGRYSSLPANSGVLQLPGWAWCGLLGRLQSSLHLFGRSGIALLLRLFHCFLIWMFHGVVLVCNSMDSFVKIMLKCNRGNFV